MSIDISPDEISPVEFITPDVGVFDTETTGVDVEQARLVSAHIGSIVGGFAGLDGRDWLVDPGIPIPPEATEVHGITNEYVEDNGITPSRAILAIIRHLQDLADAALPVVIYNASFDLTIVHREALRHLGPDAGAEVAELYEDLIVLDPFVIDKSLDRYRRGSRKLADVAEHYGLEFDRDTLHGARADARLAGALMLHLWRTTRISSFTASQIHARTVDLYREQAASFADYLHSRGRHDEACDVLTSWPWHPKDGHHDL
jgi:DNA polymerase-3 subunit epsilon